MSILAINGRIGAGKDTVAKIIQYLIYAKLKIQDNDFILSCLKDPNLSPELLEEHSGWQVKKFAGKLKQIVALLTGCKVEDLENQEFKNREVGPEWTRKYYTIAPGKTEFDEDEPSIIHHWNLTYRDVLQRVGTEAMRDNVHTNVWVNALFADYIPTVYRSIVSVRAAGFLDSHIYPKWIISDMRFPNEMQAIKERGGITICVRRPGTDVGSTHPSETALDQSPFHYIIDNDGTIEELIEKVREILIKENLL